VVGSGGVLDIEGAGTVTGETFLSGSHLTVGSGASYTVSAGKTLANVGVFIASGGTENIASGGVETGTNFNGVNGTLNILAGGKADHIGAASGGVINVAGGSDESSDGRITAKISTPTRSNAAAPAANTVPGRSDQCAGSWS
jgi:hypothetical protein